MAQFTPVNSPIPVNAPLVDAKTGMLSRVGLAYFNKATITLYELPKAPDVADQPPNSVTLYAIDDGAGKTQLMAQFGTGAPVLVAIEP